MSLSEMLKLLKRRLSHWMNGHPALWEELMALLRKHRVEFQRGGLLDGSELAAVP
jgi:hypothetical protein